MRHRRDNKRCAVCGQEIKWPDLEIHHINEHQNGGQTTIDNGVPVHKECHPKGQKAIDFNNNWKANKQQIQEINDAITNEKIKENTLNTNSSQDLEAGTFSKSPTPTASEW